MNACIPETGMRAPPERSHARKQHGQREGAAHQVRLLAGHWHALHSPSTGFQPLVRPHLRRPPPKMGFRHELTAES